MSTKQTFLYGKHIFDNMFSYSVLVHLHVHAAANVSLPSFECKCYSIMHGAYTTNRNAACSPYLKSFIAAFITIVCIHQIFVINNVRGWYQFIILQRTNPMYKYYRGLFRATSHTISYTLNKLQICWLELVTAAYQLVHTVQHPNNWTES